MEKKNEVIENILKRRSCRSYKEDQVKIDDIKTIVEAGCFAPSGRNTQNWHFTVVQNKELLLELNERIKKAENRSADYNCYYHAPTLILVSHEKDSRLAAADCACALENMFLAATSLGIDSCWINQPGANSENIDVRNVFNKLGIPENHNVYGCASLGFATDLLKTPPRKENIVHYVQ